MRNAAKEAGRKSGNADWTTDNCHPERSEGSLRLVHTMSSEQRGPVARGNEPERSLFRFTESGREDALQVAWPGPHSAVRTPHFPLRVSRAAFRVSRYFPFP